MVDFGYFNLIVSFWVLNTEPTNIKFVINASTAFIAHEPTEKVYYPETLLNFITFPIQKKLTYQRENFSLNLISDKLVLNKTLDAIDFFENFPKVIYINIIRIFDCKTKIKRNLFKFDNIKLFVVVCSWKMMYLESGYYFLIYIWESLPEGNQNL